MAHSWFIHNTPDFSDLAVLEVILGQFIDREWRPIAFFSHKLQPAETHYSTFDREIDVRAMAKAQAKEQKTQSLKLSGRSA